MAGAKGRLPRDRALRRYRAQQTEVALITPDNSQARLHSPRHAFVKGHSFLYKAVLVTFPPQRFYSMAMVFVSHCHIILGLSEEEEGGIIPIILEHL